MSLLELLLTDIQENIYIFCTYQVLVTIKMINKNHYLSVKQSKNAISINIINYKYLGLLTELEISILKNEKNIKILIFSNILDKVLLYKKLLFNKDWAFVFPIK